MSGIKKVQPRKIAKQPVQAERESLFLMKRRDTVLLAVCTATVSTTSLNLLFHDKMVLPFFPSVIFSNIFWLSNIRV